MAVQTQMGPHKLDRTANNLLGAFFIALVIKTIEAVSIQSDGSLQ
jgi:hypothetical protein